MTFVTCRNCNADFDADDGCCPGCGHPRVERSGCLVGDSCHDCGTPRIGANGLPLHRGWPCLNCGSLLVRLARADGQVVGDTWSPVLGEAGVVDQDVTGAAQTPQGEGLPHVSTHDVGAASRAPASPSTSDERAA